MSKKETEVVATTEKSRTTRKKVYERVRESVIPDELVSHFKKDNWDLKLVRWSLMGEEDYRYLARREREGYEFVTKDELPDWFHKTVRFMDTKARPGLVTIGDLCLMKVDSDLRNSRRQSYQDETDREVEAVDLHVFAQRKGFKNLGTRTKVMMKEPSFQE
jgi:hypothetical protein